MKMPMKDHRGHLACTFVTYARYIIFEELLSERETWIQTG